MGSNGWPAVVGYDLATELGQPQQVTALINALAGTENPNLAISSFAYICHRRTLSRSRYFDHHHERFRVGSTPPVALSATGQP